MHVQTWIAAANVTSTVVLSITGIWIAHQVNVNAEHQRAFERKSEEAVATQKRQDELFSSCLQMKIQEISIEYGKEVVIPIDEALEINKNIDTICHSVGLHELNIDNKVESAVLSDVFSKFTKLIQKGSVSGMRKNVKNTLSRP